MKKGSTQAAPSLLVLGLIMIVAPLPNVRPASAAPSTKHKNDDGWAATTMPTKSPRKSPVSERSAVDAKADESQTGDRVKVKSRDQAQKKDSAKPQDIANPSEPPVKPMSPPNIVENGNGAPMVAPLELPAANSPPKAAPEGVPTERAPSVTPSSMEARAPALEVASGDKGAKKATSYCLNIANPAIDARYVLQKKRLEDLKAELQARTADLEKKIAELQSWYEKRDAFVAKARENLVSIYANMKADAAAKQLSEMDEETSSALLAKLDARQSGAVLSEMDSKKAARLTEIMSGAVGDPLTVRQNASGSPQEKNSVPPSPKPQEISRP